jgi:hypothetical protein
VNSVGGATDEGSMKKRLGRRRRRRIRRKARWDWIEF